MRRFSKEELRHYNGLDGMPAYVAYQGKVYDVSGSFLWQQGLHQATHAAGSDLTAALKQAPHGAELLLRFPIVGILDPNG
ncbi:MAG: cytochrome B5 [Anaerolineae bacterium]|nr:cytochrome B5 [Anaerolineae bacterium]